MERTAVDRYRSVLDRGHLSEDVQRFATAVGDADRRAGELLVIGPATCEPWHFVAHLAEEAEHRRRPDLVPTWVRWHVPAGAPAHLAVGVDRLAAVARSQALLVVAPERAPEQLLDRVDDVRRRGGLVLAMDHGDDELRDLGHEVLTVPEHSPAHAFDVAQHVVTQLAPGGRASAPRLFDRLLRRTG